jgi:tetratricopeptide (TPR) repeat protein
MAKQRYNKNNQAQPQAWLKEHGILAGFGGVALASLVTIGITVFTSKTPAPSITQNNDNASTGVISTGDNAKTEITNITKGYSIEQHQKRLKAALKAAKAELNEKNSDKTKILTLEKQLAEQKVATITQQLTNLETSHQKRQAELKSTITELKTLAKDADINDAKLEAAIIAAEQGDTSKADALLAEIEAAAENTIRRAAKAAFERGKIAEANIEYQQAYEHFERAVGLVPDNALYLSEAAYTAGTLAKHQQEIQWNEKALALFIKQKGEDPPQIATLRNNLGAAYDSLGQYQKAIDYYQLALASDPEVSPKL